MGGNGKRRLEGKTALITGAADGIGRATALLFAREGAKLVLADVNEEGLKETERLVREAMGSVAIKRTDVSSESEVKALIGFAIETYARIDIICNNAGITGELAEIAQQDGTDWQKVYAVNVLGAVYAIKHAARYMQENGSGSVVNTASVAGIRSGAGTNAYSASKAAVINFTQTAACDLGAYNIRRRNAVCPGLIETGMTRPVFDLARERGKVEKLGSRCELRRYGRPEEVAQAILFLAATKPAISPGRFCRWMAAIRHLSTSRG